MNQTISLSKERLKARNIWGIGGSIRSMGREMNGSLGETYSSISRLPQGFQHLKVKANLALFPTPEENPQL